MSKAVSKWDRAGFEQRVRFCPSCSLPKLVKHERVPEGGIEFWCELCGFSFNIRMSIEWVIALGLFTEHRRMREGKTLEKYMNPDALKNWKQLYDKPTADTVWPSRGGVSLEEKLLKALQ